MFLSAHNAAAVAKYMRDFSSSSALVIPALKTGNVDLVTNAMAREVLTNKEGLATGVSYVNKEDMQEYQVTGKTVILAASACESCKVTVEFKIPATSKWISQFQ